MDKQNKDLKDLQKKYDEAAVCASHLQAMGNHLAHVTEQGKDLLKRIELSKTFNEINVSSWLARANATIPHPPLQTMRPLESYYYAVSTSTSSAYAVLTVVPSLNLDEKEFGLAREDEQELDSLLKDFSARFPSLPDLVKIRKGAWQTYHSVTEVSLMNASHDMREILRHLISQIATNDEVKQAEWWEKPKDPKVAVTTAQRLRYLIFGDQVLDSEEMIISAVKASLEAYSRLQSIAHGSETFKMEVKNFMQQVEQTLLSVMRYWKLKASLC